MTFQQIFYDYFILQEICRHETSIVTAATRHNFILSVCAKTCKGSRQESPFSGSIYRQRPSENVSVVAFIKKYRGKVRTSRQPASRILKSGSAYCAERWGGVGDGVGSYFLGRPRDRCRRFTNSASSTIQNDPKSSSQRTKHLCNDRLVRIAFCIHRQDHQEIEKKRVKKTRFLVVFFFFFFFLQLIARTFSFFLKFALDPHRHSLSFVTERGPHVCARAPVIALAVVFRRGLDTSINAGTSFAPTTPSLYRVAGTRVSDLGMISSRLLERTNSSTDSQRRDG